jgi:lysylphosphatidylglycerol synthetase-like protein (DUF2156 family)
MLILLFTFIASTVYVLKHGIGKEKLYFLYPLGAYLAYNIAFGLVLALFPSARGATETFVGIIMAVLLISICIMIVAKVRKHSMQRAMDGFRDGVPEAAVRKFEL